MRVKLYIEGGGESRSLHIKCREGFRKLFEKAGFVGRMPSIKACGGRNAAYDDFGIALRSALTDEYPILLVDSEAPVNHPAWSHLQTHDGWQRPGRAEDDQAQLMVQCMETWCVADRAALRSFFGSLFRENALPAPDDLETVSKEAIQDALDNGTRDCGRDRAYSKGKRSFDLLARLNPAELRVRLPHFDRFCRVLDEKL